MTGPRFDRYDWAGGREAMLRFGPDAGPRVVAVLPLFEEANRTRAFLVAMLRALAGHGIGSILPDLPGTGESVVETRDLRLADLRQAFAALVGRSARRFTRLRFGAVRSSIATPVLPGGGGSHRSRAMTCCAT